MQMIDSLEPNGGQTTLTLLPGIKSSSPNRHTNANLRIHISPDQDHQDFDELQLDKPPNRQVEQLVSHLREQRKDLAQREANLQSRVYEWEKEALAREGSLRKRRSEIEQHLSQVKRQQDQLMSLQQNLINSQDAIRAVVEQLVNDCRDADRIHDLQLLRDEIGNRMESNFQEWERLVRALNG